MSYNIFRNFGYLLEPVLGDLVETEKHANSFVAYCKYTTTYLDNYSSFGVMFYLKKKNDEFAAFKQYKAWAERQLGTKLKCRWFDHGGEFLSNEQKAYMVENGIETQTSMPDTPQQNGWAERFQQTIINGSEAMWHHAGLSNSFWIYAVKAKLHTYNVTLIKRADYETPTELWSGKKPNISHLVLQFNLVRAEIRELRPEVVAESDEVLVHYRSRTNVWRRLSTKTLA